MKQVFVSHAAVDKTLANKFVDLLITGTSLTHEDIFCSSLPGLDIPNDTQFVENIKNNLKNSELAVLLITESFLQSSFCSCELGAIWYDSKRSFTLIVPPVNIGDIKGVMTGKQVGSIIDSAKLDELRDIISTHLGVSTPTPRWNEKKIEFLKFAKDYIGPSHQRDLKWRGAQLQETHPRPFEASLYSLKQLFALLHWIDTVVPAEYAGTYLDRMQMTMQNGNLVFSGTDTDLLFSIDTLLRVLSRIQGNEDYSLSKLHASYNSLQRYVSKHGSNIPDFLPGEIFDIANEIRGEIAYGKAKMSAAVPLDQYALMLIEGLATYLAEISRDKLYRNIDQNIQNPLRKFIENGLLVNCGLSLPEMHALDEIRGLKSLCEDSWKNSIACRKAESFKDKYVK